MLLKGSIIALVLGLSGNAPSAPSSPVEPSAPQVETPAAPSLPAKKSAAPAKATGEAKTTEKTDKADKAEKADKPAEKTAENEKPAKSDKAEKPARVEKVAKAIDRSVDRTLERRAARAAAERDRSPAPVMPAVTGSAMRQELRGAGGGVGPSSEGRPAGTGGTEREKLEQLAAEIARAREALKQDTARLETMLRNGGTPGEGGALPMGDGMAASSGMPSGGALSKEQMKEQLATVSKALKGMKPEQAAAIISRLDRQLAAEIVRRMAAKDAGAVLAQLKPELAAELATMIATKKSAVDDGKKEAAK